MARKAGRGACRGEARVMWAEECWRGVGVGWFDGGMLVGGVSGGGGVFRAGCDSG